MCSVIEGPPLKRANELASCTAAAVLRVNVQNQVCGDFFAAKEVFVDVTKEHSDGLFGGLYHECASGGWVSNAELNQPSHLLRVKGENGVCALAVHAPAELDDSIGMFVSHRRDAHDDVHDAMPQARASFGRQQSSWSRATASQAW
jgi:hypothetical protein